METQAMIIVTLLVTISGISKYCEAGSVGNAQYNHTHDALKCYSCISIGNFPNMSAEGCGKSHPPPHYITQDCFGYNSPQALAAIRHAAGADQSGYSVDSSNVHCVHIKGRNDAAGEVNVRGCIPLPTGEVYETKTCITKNDLIFLPFGNIQNAEYCYCKGHGCNGSTRFVETSFLTFMIFPLISLANRGFQV